MALSFGQILSGAGAIARSTREEQSKQLQLQEQQMRLAELRRLQAEQELERQALQQGQGGYQTVPLFTAGAPMQPTQIQAPQQQNTQPQQQAAQQQTQAAAQEAQTAVQQPYTPTAESPLALGARYLQGYPQRQTERFAEAEGVSGKLGAVVGGAADVIGSTLAGAGSYAESLAREQIRRREEGVRNFLRGAGLDVGDESVLRSYDEMTGRVPSEEEPETTDTQTATTAEKTAQPPANEQNPATAVAEESPPQTGVTEQTQRIFSNTDFYLGDPNAITPEMQNVANQREELVRMADIYRRNGMVNKYQETLTRLKEVDDSLIYLQGMRGVNELRTFNNPLRLEQALSYVTGQTIRLRPRTDGNYDYLVADPDGNFVVAQAGVSTEALANRAIFTLDRNAAVQAAQRSAELQQLAQEEAIKARAAMSRAAFEAGLERPELATLADGQTDILIGGTGLAPSFNVITPPVPAGREGGFLGIGSTPTEATYYGLRSFEGFENNLSDQQIENIINTPEFRTYWSNRQGD